MVSSWAQGFQVYQVPGSSGATAQRFDSHFWQVFASWAYATSMAITTPTTPRRAIGGGGDYENSISLDQVYAAHVEEQTRFSSLIMSTDGGTGPQHKAHTISSTLTDVQSLQNAGRNAYSISCSSKMMAMRPNMALTKVCWII